MSCKYGMDTCAFRDTPEVCADCEDADSYEWDERIPTPQDDEEENRIWRSAPTAARPGRPKNSSHH